MSVRMSCNGCGASIESSSVEEAIAWSEAHDPICPTPANPGRP